MKNFKMLLFSVTAIMLAMTSFTALEKEWKKTENPVKLTVIYGHPDDPQAFEEYYFSTHKSLANKIKGVSRMELTKFDAAPDAAKSPYYRMAELYFPNVEAMQATLNSVEGKAALEDLPNFATGGVTAIVGIAEDFAFLEP